MNNHLAMYLAGTIKKGHEKQDETFWTEDNIKTLREGLKPYQVTFLNPAFRKDDLSDNTSVFGRDMLQVFSADVVFVDARDRRGLGVGAEMMWAKLNNIPLVIWAPEESHYNKSHTTILGIHVDKFVHPFVECLSDKIVNDLEEGISWIKQIKADPSAPIKGIEFIELAMSHYKNKQLPNDEPMLNLIKGNEILQSRFSLV